MTRDRPLTGAWELALWKPFVHSMLDGVIPLFGDAGRWPRGVTDQGPGLALPRPGGNYGANPGPYSIGGSRARYDRMSGSASKGSHATTRECQGVAAITVPVAVVCAIVLRDAQPPPNDTLQRNHSIRTS